MSRGLGEGGDVNARMWEEGYLQGGRDERWSIKWDNTLRNDEGW